ncbi:MAG: DNA-binding protein Alba [Candidatus Aenigmarchaeota archaeon]|nr:DNA-binding protein Alba [Candidatus Aenigmarchaeota archaeon]MCX8190759.1 DNA-binding protein Alba [Candidatus Aenigmarchaeota archaeon]MDW8160006.1 DNA-binding protein Alba [Candidatus Aenigmarchaeota archaeon]
MPEEANQQENVVFIGKKPTMSYVLAVITQFTNGQKEVHIKARGRSISRAVDVAQVIQRRFMPDVKIKKIDLGTEEKEVEGKGKLNVSTIDITLSK